VQTALVDLLLEKAAESYFASVETTGRARELGAPGFALEVRGAEGGAGLWLGSASQDGRLRALRWDVDASGASTPLEDDAGAGGTGWIVVLPAPTAQRIEARAKDLWTAVGSGAW
jgi:hypothetical protein